MTKIKKLLIDDGAYIDMDFFKTDFIRNGVEEVWIENCFEKDMDICTNFGQIQTLQRFRILNPNSAYYVEDDLLYIDIVGYDETAYETFIKNLPEDTFIVEFDETLDETKTKNLDNTFYSQSNLGMYLTGRVLISIPPAIQRKNIIIPEGVVAIAPGAIMNCNLDSLTLPWSLREVECPIIDSKITELIVHNWGERTEWNYASINSTISTIRTAEGDPLDKNIKRYWSCDLNENDIRYVNELDDPKLFEGNETIPF